MTIADQSQPIAQGDLAKTPFAHLVLYLHRETLSGTLVIERGGFESKVLFRNGRAVAARPLPRGTALQDGLLELCALESAPYTFWDGDLLGDSPGVIQGTVDPLTFVTDSVRTHARDAVIASVVDRYRTVQLRLLPGADPRRLGIRGAEARAAECLREQAWTPEEFAARAELSTGDARRLLYLLIITSSAVPQGHDGSGVRSAVGNSVSPAGAASGRPPTPSLRPGTLSQPPQARSNAPGAKQPGSASQQPGARIRSPLPPAAPAGAGSSRRPVNPASLPAWQQLASMRAASMRSNATPVPQVVVPSAAPAPFEALDEGGKLRRAEFLAERRSFDDAMRIVDELIAHDARNAEYQALRAFILYQQFTGDDPPRRLLEAIERALRSNEQHPRALYLKALVLKRMGKENESLRYFQRTLDADPQHIEAQRELRLARMRRDK